MSIEDFNVLVATEEHTPFAQAICDEMAESAKPAALVSPNVLPSM